jgi:methylenetetrahydrofolate reductase (NADPH)
MATGSPPGCWASPELVELLRRESEAPDGGLAARLERAAKMVAVLKGLGYAGAYIGGTHSADQISQILERARELDADWEACAAELQFGERGGFYLDDARTAPPPSRSLLPAVLDAAGRALPMPWSRDAHETPMRRGMQRLFAWVDSKPALRSLFERFEYWGKRPMFGCEACGNCVLGQMEYVCPQTCPKQMRNGPCGGTLLGRCEVVDQECIWVSVYQRAEAAGRVPDLQTRVPAPDRSLQGTSSWVNYFMNRDSRPGRPKVVDETTAPADPVRQVRNVRTQPPAPAPTPIRSESEKTLV